MPLTTCPDCGRDVSTIAMACPQCGRPVAQTASDPAGAAELDLQYRAPRAEAAGPAQWSSPLRLLYWAILMRICLVVLGAIGTVVFGMIMARREVHTHEVASTVTTIFVVIEILYLVLWLPVLFAIHRYRQLPAALRNGRTLGLAFTMACVDATRDLVTRVGLLDVAHLDPLVAALLVLPMWIMAFALAAAFAETAATLRWEPITRSPWRLRWYLFATALLSFCLAGLRSTANSGPTALLALGMVVMGLLSLARFAREAHDLAIALDFAQKQAERG